MKKQTVWTIIFTILVISLLTAEIIYTYSLFETNTTLTTSSDIAKWNIKVNNNMITNGQINSSAVEIGSIDWGNGSHVLQGKAAPGSVGTFDIEIDPTDTDVSFLYKIIIDTSKLENEEFKISSVTELNGNEFIRTNENEYTGIARLEENKNGKKYNIRIGITWNNNEANNEKDYELGIKAEQEVKLPIIIMLSQYIGTETITSYVVPTSPVESTSPVSQVEPEEPEEPGEQGG